MNYPPNVWNQLKNLTKDELIHALIKDDWTPDTKLRTERVYRHSPGRRVSIHYHLGSDTFKPSLLKSLLEEIGWTEQDMKRLKLIR